MDSKPDLRARPGAFMRIRVAWQTDDRGVIVRRLHFDGREVEIMETVDQWFGPDYRYVKVRSRSGDLYILRFDEPHDRWSLVMYRRAQDKSFA